MEERGAASDEAAVAMTQEGAKDWSSMAYLRERFLTALVDWLQMHDYHAPFPQGPPRKDQPCAKIENEHTQTEHTFCGKLFPRKLIAPGCEEVSEDPRRRELYRVWLARNCSFVNNYMPAMLLAGLSNMDMQATLTKTGVIEYMTKYMTKTGMGTLIGLMERSFTACLDKARDDGKGAGAAMLRWFNLTSMAEVKSQLETMHLCFQMPRYLCSREFSRLSVKSDYKKLKDVADVEAGIGRDEKLTHRGQAQVYLDRVHLTCPKDAALDKDKHPVTGQPMRAFIGERAGEELHESLGRQEMNRIWQRCVLSLSWWEVKRLFRLCDGKYGSLRFKCNADIVIVSPAPRLAKGLKDESWFESCRMALLAYRNHGPGVHGCEEWNLRHLQAWSHEKLEEQLSYFVEADDATRQSAGMCPCPPFLRRSWLLGKLRQESHAKARRTQAETVCGMPRPTVPLPGRSWAATPCADMTSEMYKAAVAAWKEANEEETRRESEAMAGAGASNEAAEAAADANGRMRRCMRADLGWKTEILHDALCSLSEAAPGSPSDLCYFRRLHAQLKDSAACQQPQNRCTHSKQKLLAVLRALRGGGCALGGLSGNKIIIAQRVASILDYVVQKGCETAEADALRGEEEDVGGDGGPSQKRRRECQEFDPQGPSWRLQGLHPKVVGCV